MIVGLSRWLQRMVGYTSIIIVVMNPFGSSRSEQDVVISLYRKMVNILQYQQNKVVVYIEHIYSIHQTAPQFGSMKAQIMKDAGSIFPRIENILYVLEEVLDEYGCMREPIQHRFGHIIQVDL